MEMSALYDTNPSYKYTINRQCSSPQTVPEIVSQPTKEAYICDTLTDQFLSIDWTTANHES